VRVLLQLTRMVLPGLLAKKKGAVVFISSTAGIFTLPMLANYSACKVRIYSYSSIPMSISKLLLVKQQ
jgi:short-subunit dehydrogenase